MLSTSTQARSGWLGASLCTVALVATVAADGAVVWWSAVGRAQADERAHAAKVEQVHQDMRAVAADVVRDVCTASSEAQTATETSGPVRLGPDRCDFRVGYARRPAEDGGVTYAVFAVGDLECDGRLELVLATGGATRHADGRCDVRGRPPSDSSSQEVWALVGFDPVAEVVRVSQR